MNINPSLGGREENESGATFCEMPEWVNYRGRWRDDRFNGAEAPVHTPGRDSATTMFALTGVPPRELTMKYTSCQGILIPPRFIIIFKGDGVLMDRGNINFTDKLPLE